MTDINEWVKLAVLDFEENPYYAQNGVNRSICSLETFKPEIKIDVVKSARTLCATLYSELMPCTRDILGNLRIRISDAWEKSAPR